MLLVVHHVFSCEVHVGVILQVMVLLLFLTEIQLAIVDEW